METVSPVKKVKTVLTETLTKKWDIAKRICEPLNDKRFKWEKQEDGTFRLSGIETIAVYHDETSEVARKGFIHYDAKGKKVLQDSTLNVGVFISSIKPSLEKAMIDETVGEEAAK